MSTNRQSAIPTCRTIMLTASLVSLPLNISLQVLNVAWDVSLPVCSENALPCHDRGGYNCLLEKAKPQNDPDGKHIFAFTYLRLSPLLMDGQNHMEFERFVKRMHGKGLQLFGPFFW